MAKTKAPAAPPFAELSLEPGASWVKIKNALDRLDRDRQQSLSASEILTVAAALQAVGALDKPIVNSNTVLTLACEMRDLPLIKALLSLGANVNAPTQYQQSPLMQVIHGLRNRGDRTEVDQALACMKTLLAAGADIHHRNQCEQQAIHWASWDLSFIEITRWLLSVGADPSSPEKGDCFTPLHHAAKHADADTVRLLLEAGADPMLKAKDQDKWVEPLGVAIHWSAYVGGNYEVMLILADAMQARLAQDERQALDEAASKAPRPGARPGI